MKAGDVLIDNDPRMKGRKLTIQSIGPREEYVLASDGRRFAPFKISTRRIYADTKTRKSGFRLVSVSA